MEIRLGRSQLKKDDAFEDLSIKITNSFYDSFGFRPGRVYLLKNDSIPMTYNGKIKYIQLQEQYNNGFFKKERIYLFSRVLRILRIFVSSQIYYE